MRLSIVRPVLVSLLLVGCLTSSNGVRAEGKVGTVSLQRALNESEEGKKAKAAIQAEFETKKKQFEGTQAELKKLREDLEKQKSVLSQEALQAKAGELQQKFLDFQQKAMQTDQDLKTKEAQSAQKIISALRAMVPGIAKAGGYEIVYENSGEVILYSAHAVDLTPELIKAYNSGGGSGAAPKK